VPSATPDALELMLQLTQSMQSIQKMVEGQQKSASREIPQEARVAMEGALQGVADTGKQHDDAMGVATNVLKDNKVSTLCGKNEHITFGSGSYAQTLTRLIGCRVLLTFPKKTAMQMPSLSK
jgi:hypothetical protein